MAKASLNLKNGTVINIEGTAAEIHQLLEFYDSAPRASLGPKRSSGAIDASHGRAESTEKEHRPTKTVDLTIIVNYIKTCDEAEQIEKKILDKTDQLTRVLLPLYVVCEHLDNVSGLTSGDVSKVTTELGIPISVANASRTLSGSASKYVMGDKVRKKGQPVRYKLSRRGHAFVKAMLAPKAA